MNNKYPKFRVPLQEIIYTDEYRQAVAKSKQSVPLGIDEQGRPVIADIARMPHLLIGGGLMTGVDGCVFSMILSIINNAPPEEVRIVFIPKSAVDLWVNKATDHIAFPLTYNLRDIADVFPRVEKEMDRRYNLFEVNNVKNIDAYNKLCEHKNFPKMCRIVVFALEYVDALEYSPEKAVDSVCRIAQVGRAAGIHLVLAATRLSAWNRLTAANIPSRIAFSVSNVSESRKVLDTDGAEKLEGNGDMLYLPLGSSKPLRVRGCTYPPEATLNPYCF